MFCIITTVLETEVVMNYINEEKRKELARDYSEQFKNADPFPYVKIDNFLNPDKLKEVLDVFPSPKELAFYKYENPLEKKVGDGSTIQASSTYSKYSIVFKFP